MAAVKNVHVYRDFVFCRLSEDEAGVSFEDYFGQSLSTIDNMVDRSPEGKLEVARTMLRSGIDRSTVMKMTGLTEDDLAQIRH